MPRIADAVTQASHRFGLQPKDPPSYMQPVLLVPLVLSDLGRFFFKAPGAVLQYDKRTFFLLKRLLEFLLCLAAKSIS